MKIKRYLIKITKNYEAIITGMTAWMKRQRWLEHFYREAENRMLKSS
jgi:hypothetical protein